MSYLLEHIFGKRVFFFKIENMRKKKKRKKKQSYLEIFIFHPLAPRGISQDIFGVYYVQRSLGYNINVSAKFYTLGRAKVFSSIETDFWSSTKGNHVKYVDEMCQVEMAWAEFLRN